MTKEEIIKRFKECVKEVSQDFERLNNFEFTDLINRADEGWEVSDILNETFYDLFQTALMFRDLANECEKIGELQ